MFKNPMAGLISALVILMTGQTPLLKSLKSAARVVGNTALVRMTVYIQVCGNGCTRYLLTQRRMNVRVLAEAR